MHNHLKLDGLKIFHVAARTLSFKQAADDLGLTPTAISHRISTLEDQLGARLFTRGVRQIMLTDEGRILLGATNRAFPILAQAVAKIDRTSAPRTASISATTAFASHWLIPRAGHFSRKHPDLLLSIRADNGLADVAAGDADIAIRYGPIDLRPNTQALLLGHDRFIALCSPLYWDAVMAGREPLRLIHYGWDRKDRSAPTWDIFPLKLPQLPGGAPQPERLHLSDEISAFAATLSGQGIALLSDWLVQDYCAQASLIRPFEGSLDGFAYHMVMPEKPSRTALALKDWVIENLGGN